MRSSPAAAAPLCRWKQAKGGTYLLQIEAVGDVVGGEEGGHQMGDGASLATVWTELEGVEIPLPTRGVGLF